MNYFINTVKKINELRETKANRRVKVMYKALLIDTHEPDLVFYNLKYCHP